MQTHTELDVPAYLSVLPLFHEMRPAELERIAESAALKRFVRGEEVFRVGEPCEGFHVVVAGQVKLYALSHSGHEKVIELISPGNSFAEALMFTGKPYIVNAQTLSDSLVLTVKKQAVMAEIERDPRFSLRMLAGISRRLHGLVQDVEASALHSGIQRVIGYLLRDQSLEDVVPGQVATVQLPVSKATIASLLSLTPEYFSRVLRELEDGGLIAMDRRDIRILDVQGLSRYHLQ
ncbi:Crp/Fnr family transcriptional regulator [Aquabacterium sp.]|uniref:Crp/Fnr family transcriptional regulator n=1 Tax=Aquabacterium sp. TaxID=1872578 RepID=UPI003B72A7A0